DYFECRHAFYPAPIIPHNDERYKTLQLLFERMLLLCADYGVTQEDTVKITPSKKALNALGQRAIPYYYLTRPPLVRTWDALKTQTYSHLKNLGYQSGFLSTDDEIQNPLDYDISASDFYRIEGHLGLDYFDALQQVQDIKEDKGLPFDVKVLSINEDIANIDPEDYKCHFEDLNTILLAFLKEQECLYGDMAQFFSNFSTTNPGTHGRYGVKTLATAPPQEEVEEETGATTTTVPATTAVPTRRITPGDFTIASTRHIKARASTKLPEENLPLYFVPIKTKTPKKTIEEKIVSNEESLGYVVNSIMAKHADREPATLARKIRDEVNKIEAIAVLAPNVREVAVTFPYELIVYSREAAQHIPSTIADLSDAKLQRFNEASDRLCELVDNYQIALNNVLNNPQSNYQRRGFEPRMEMLLNQMASNCCAAEKIQVLMDDIERRKIEILTQKTLTAFAEKHPGMEHKAGVQPGGTFVMVYMGGRRRPNIPANSLISNTLAAARATNTREGAVLPKRALLNERAAVRIASHINLTEGSPTASRVPLAGPTELVALESDRIRPENNINILSAPNRRGPQQTPNITLNTIVADFSLPYMCCSDCAPINFIIPQAPVSLRLPQAQICYDKAEPPAPLLFEVIPADGIVKSTLSDGDNGGVIKNGDGNYVFDAGLIDPSHYGQTLEFTVNDQVTDATIVVNEIPKFTFEFTEPLYFKDGILAEVNFTVQGENFDAATTFIWEFGDGNESTEANPRHLYELTPNGGETIDFNVTLTVGKGACTHTETGTVTLDLQMPRIFIEESVCIPRQSTFETTVQFGTQPDGATVEITNDVPNVRIAENTLVFNRQFNAYGTPIEFAVNGHSVENTTTAIVRPEASIFVPNEQELFFNDNGECRIEFGINNQSVFDESLFNYHWDTGDGSNSTTVQPAHTHTFRVDPSTNRDVMRYTVTLVIEGEPSCEFRTSRPITIHVNHENL
ncbi:MAG: PKD domain-containing protein, partial [Marinirhabdus sp.]